MKYRFIPLLFLLLMLPTLSKEDMVAFSLINENTSSIGILDLRDGREEILTPPNLYFNPSWSPDGSEIVFYQWQFPQIAYIVDLHSRQIRKLTFKDPKISATAMRYPSWSPKGDKILFSGHVYLPFLTLGLFTVRPDGSEVKRIDGTGHDDKYPSWSYDERKIAFTRSDDIFIIDLRTNELTPITRTPTVREAYPMWAPGEYRIAYTSYDPQTGENSIHIYDLVRKRDMKLKLPKGLALCQMGKVDWLPDGRRLVFSAEEDDSPPNLYIIDVSGNRVEQLTRDLNEGKQTPDWWGGYTAVKPLNLLNTLWSSIKTKGVGLR